MMEEKPKIEIPDPLFDASQLFRGQTEEIRKSFNTLIYFVIGVMLTGIVMMMFTVVSIVFQSWQFNKTAQDALQQIEIQEKVVQAIKVESSDIKKQLQTIEDKLQPTKKLQDK